jgi:hypothetical protein
MYLKDGGRYATGWSIRKEKLSYFTPYLEEIVGDPNNIKLHFFETEKEQKKAKKLPISAAPSDHDVINFERHHPKTWLVFAGIGSVRRAVS